MSMPTETTPNMGLVLPVPIMTAGPGYAYLLDAAQYVIDSHDHSTGKGVQITPAGINISSDLTFNQNNATNLRTARLYNNSSISLGINDKTALYALNNELYYVDGAGNQVQITLNGAIDLSSSISLINIKDTNFTLEYFGDISRKAQFSAANVPTNTEQIFILPPVAGSGDTLVSTSSSQTLINKTLTGNTAANLISGSGELILNTSGTMTVPNGTDTLVDLTGSQTLTNKILTGNTAANLISGSGVLILPTSGTVTVPNVIDTVATLAATQTFTNKTLGGTVVQSANAIQFNNSANTFYTSLGAGANTANYVAKLPVSDGTSGQVLQTNGSGQWSWGTVATTTANVAANDSNVVFTASSARFQDCTPTAARTYQLPSTGVPQGDTWNFYNNSSFLITVQSSGANTIGYVYPYSTAQFIAQVAAPTTAANWLQLTIGAQLIKGNILGAQTAGFLGEVIETTVNTATNFPGASGAWGDLTSVSLTAGIWDISLCIITGVGSPAATGLGTINVGISTTSGNSSTGLVGGTNLFTAAPPTTTYNNQAIISPYRQAFTTTTTVYGKGMFTSSTGAPQFLGRLSAVRVG